jgi:hypothetical protein
MIRIEFKHLQRKEVPPTYFYVQKVEDLKCYQFFFRPFRILFIFTSDPRKGGSVRSFPSSKLFTIEFESID